MKPSHVVAVATSVCVALYLQAIILFIGIFLEHFGHLYQIPAFVVMFLNLLGIPFSYCTLTLADNDIFHTHFKCLSYAMNEDSERWRLYVALVCLAVILFRVQIAERFRTTFV